MGEIGPIQILFFDESNFPIPIPLLQLFLSTNGRLRIVEGFDMDKPRHTMLAYELGSQSRAMFFKATRQIACNADVKRAVAFARKNVNGIHALIL